MKRWMVLVWLTGWLLHAENLPAETIPQPLAQQVRRLAQTMAFLGVPFHSDLSKNIEEALQEGSMADLDRLLETRILFHVTINPESKVSVRQGKAEPLLHQGGYRPFLVKVINQAVTTAPLSVSSPQAGPVYGGMTALSARRMQREALHELEDPLGDPERFIDVTFYEQAPMTPGLSSLEVEFKLLWIYTHRSGLQEATFTFDVGQGTQDIGFRAEIPILFRAEAPVDLTLQITEADGTPSTARLVFRDLAGHVFPPQAKRLAPDFYFQEQIYRHHGQHLSLPAGDYTLESSRGPEYLVTSQNMTLPRARSHTLDITLHRWIQPSDYGFYSGDHHIHGAGCAHYTSPTQGVQPSDMYLQVRGEGLNVGCVLTWGPCFDFQRRFFSAKPLAWDDPFTLLKYDLEISGFGSQAMGHVCLLNLKDQTYPGSNGTKDKGWPTWTTPVMRWAKSQGGVVGYAHSASGLQIEPERAAQRLMNTLDQNQDQLLTLEETQQALLPLPFEQIDEDRDQALSKGELSFSMDQEADQLPNWVVPEMNSVGAMEIGVSAALGACDFISAMDTARIPEWNMWYHLLNCGFPIKVSGETDFPCMSGSRVGQGRVYVQLGKVDQLSFDQWCQGLQQGRSYVSDGYAHALDFRVAGIAPGFGKVSLSQTETVRIKASVAFAPATPQTVAQGLLTPPGGKRFLGDTVTFHGPPPEAVALGGTRTVELIVNGNAVRRWIIPADGAIHDLETDLSVDQSSWVALRQFPQLHTNPVEVILEGKPIRVSKRSAQWCAETIKQLWRTRGHTIHESEQKPAKEAFDRALAIYREIAKASP